MKVSMFLVKHGKRDEIICAFICTGCGKPIKDIREANFAPATTDYDKKPEKIATNTWFVEEMEIWHWSCDDEHTIPWKNAADAFKAYLDAGVNVPG